MIVQIYVRNCRCFFKFNKKEFMKHLPFVIIVFVLILSCSSDSENTTQEQQDTTAPTVAIAIAGFDDLDSAEPIVVSGEIRIAIAAEDANGVAKVEAFINEEKVGEDTAPPFEITADLTGFDSKINSDQFKQYTLRIVATDNSGNTAQLEQAIQIDNELPMITEVSLEDGAVINGDINPVTFSVIDNQLLNQVVVFVNDMIIADIEDENFEANINTLELQDGSNTLRIDAIDSAENRATYQSSFVVDNSGPEITISNVIQNQILDEPINLIPSVSDKYSEVVSFEIQFREALLASYENGTAISYEFLPDTFDVGEGVLELTGTDNLANTTTVSIPVEILRLLLKVSIPEDYLSSSSPARHFVFTNDQEGAVIDVKEVLFESREIEMHSKTEFSNEQRFSVTFASLVNGGSSYLFSMQDLTRQVPGTLQLEVPNRFASSGSNFYPITGFDSTTQLNCFGRDYSFSSDAEGRTLLTTFIPTNHGIESEQIYIYGFNPTNNFYNYQLIDKQIPEGFTIDFADFTTEGLEERQFNTVPGDMLTTNSSTLRLFGYDSQEAFTNDIYATLWSYSYGSGILSTYNYTLNTNFYAYAHEITVGNYHSQGNGIPEEVLNIPDWSIDYTFENNLVMLSKSGIGHTNGEVFLNGGFESGNPYTWNVVFNSDRNSVLLPRIPNELNNFPVFGQYNNANLQIERVGLIKYEAINSYPDFINNIIKENNYFERSAPRFESIFNAVNGGYQTFRNSSANFLFNP